MGGSTMTFAQRVPMPAVPRPSIVVRVAATAVERAACDSLRRAVFIDEQHVPEADEWDGHDDEAVHFLAVEGDRPVGTARLRFLPDGVGKAERVAVARDRRGAGIGRRLMDALVERVRAAGGTAVQLASEVAAIPFYERLGWIAEGDVFDDAGIPHRHMFRNLTP